MHFENVLAKISKLRAETQNLLEKLRSQVLILRKMIMDKVEVVEGSMAILDMVEVENKEATPGLQI